MLHGSKSAGALGIVCSNSFQEQEDNDRILAVNIADWERVANDGGATSARCPESCTPPPRLMDGFHNDIPSPDVLKPFRKAQLAASKRLEKAMKPTSKAKAMPKTAADRDEKDRSQELATAASAEDEKRKTKEKKRRKTRKKRKIQHRRRRMLPRFPREPQTTAR